MPDDFNNGSSLKAFKALKYSVMFWGLLKLQAQTKLLSAAAVTLLHLALCTTRNAMPCAIPEPILKDDLPEITSYSEVGL